MGCCRRCYEGLLIAHKEVVISCYLVNTYFLCIVFFNVLKLNIVYQFNLSETRWNIGGLLQTPRAYFRIEGKRLTSSKRVSYFGNASWQLGFPLVHRLMICCVFSLCFLLWDFEDPWLRKEKFRDLLFCILKKLKEMPPPKCKKRSANHGWTEKKILISRTSKMAVLSFWE